MVKANKTHIISIAAVALVALATSVPEGRAGTSGGLGCCDGDFQQVSWQCGDGSWCTEQYCIGHDYDNVGIENSCNFCDCGYVDWWYVDGTCTPVSPTRRNSSADAGVSPQYVFVRGCDGGYALIRLYPLSGGQALGG